MTANPTPVSFDDESMILVDAMDRVLGYDTKLNVHQGAGKLHRAFSVFIFSDLDQVLMQKRSLHKSLWPSYWSNSCCSHPRKGENCLQAAHRRIYEELGFDTELRFLYQFQYHAAFFSIGAESELCSVYAGWIDKHTQITFNTGEIAEWQWLQYPVLDQLIAADPSAFTPWFLLEWACLRSQYWDTLVALKQ